MNKVNKQVSYICMKRRDAWHTWFSCYYFTFVAKESWPDDVRIGWGSRVLFYSPQTHSSISFQTEYFCFPLAWPLLKISLIRLPVNSDLDLVCALSAENFLFIVLFANETYSRHWSFGSFERSVSLLISLAAGFDSSIKQWKLSLSKLRRNRTNNRKRWEKAIDVWKKLLPI